MICSRNRLSYPRPKINDGLSCFFKGNGVVATSEAVNDERLCKKEDEKEGAVGAHFGHLVYDLVRVGNCFRR